MGFRIRPAHVQELPALSELCLRSKAVWGYDRGFIEACRAELTIRTEEISRTRLGVADEGCGPAGVAQVGRNGDDAEILKLFVEPVQMGRGVGRILFDWCVVEAQALGARRLLIESDPNAAAFYDRMGATRIGTAPSGSVQGRVLPLFGLPLA